MVWSTKDGRHEGYVAPLFGDGALGIGWEPRGVTVSRRPGPERPLAERQIRRGSDAVGWMGVCGCGWRGAPYRWVHVPEAEERGALTAYSPDSFPPSWVEEAVRLDWRRHADRHEAVNEVAAMALEVERANRRLEEAVMRARTAGSSWASVGGAAGISGQAAHERWAAIATAEDPRNGVP